MVKNLIIFIVIVLIAGVGLYYLKNRISEQKISPTETQQLSSILPNMTPTGSSNPESPAEIILTEGLDTPWAIAFFPNQSMLVTERKGTIRLVDKSGKLQEAPVAVINNVKEIGEGGLLGIALDPNFASNNYLYLYYTYENQGENTKNRVVRMKYANGTLIDEQIIVDGIPGASNHNGGRIKFGPDNFLYITTGDAQEPSLAQDKNSLAGKILRVTGPSANSGQVKAEVFSLGHRNPQGIAWDASGNLWETEHGPSGGSLGTGNDEINLIEPGRNYGWPEIQGDQTRGEMVTPVKNSTPQVSWAPAGAAFIGSSLFFAGLKGQTLYEVVIENNQITDFKEHFKGKYGRIREVITGPDGMLYITTSNQDGRGKPNPNDDKIIRINPQKL